MYIIWIIIDVLYMLIISIWEKFVDMNGNLWFLIWKLLCIVGIEMLLKDIVDEFIY